MNDNDSYQSWLERRRSLDVSEDFSTRIIDQIRRDQQTRQRRNRKRLVDLWPERISLPPFYDTAAAVSAVIVGAVRLALILQIVLSF